VSSGNVYIDPVVGAYLRFKLPNHCHLEWLNLQMSLQRAEHMMSTTGLTGANNDIDGGRSSSMPSRGSQRIMQNLASDLVMNKEKICQPCMRFRAVSRPAMPVPKE
jgi:hypothetical protein